MRVHLVSLCGGNWRGYKGSKEEIEEMFKKCYEDAEYMHADTDSLDYAYERREQLEPDENGEYTIEYWSKW